MPDDEFELWFAAADRHCRNIAGVSLSDLTDQPYRDWYEDGMRPMDAAVEALLDNDFPFPGEDD